MERTATVVLWWVCGALMVCVVSCSDAGAEPKPEAPDMSQLLADFSSPSADVDAQTMVDLRATIAETTAVFFGVGNLEFLLGDLLGGLSEDEVSEESEAALQSSLTVREQPATLGDASLEGEGFLRVVRICNGWEGGTTPDEEADGNIDLTVGFTAERVDPVVWGTFSNCRYAVTGADGEMSNMLMRGTVNIWLGEDATFDSLGEYGQHPFVVSIAGLIALGESELEQLDFRFVPESGEFSLKIQTRGGHVLYTPFTGQDQRVEGANGSWTCDFEASLCASDDDPNTTFTF